MTTAAAGALREVALRLRRPAALSALTLPLLAASALAVDKPQPFDPLGLHIASHPSLTAPFAWFALPEGVQEAIKERAGVFAPLVSFLLFIVINQRINSFRREQEARAAQAAGRAIAEATERTLRSVAPEQWGKLVLCVLIDLAGDASFLLPGIGEVSDVVYGPLEGVLLAQLFRSNALGVIGVLEEGLPFTDEIPTATLGWVLETFFADSPLGKLLGLKFPEDRKKEAENDRRS